MRVLKLILSNFGTMFLISKGRITFTQLKIHDQFVTDPKLIADAFANYFKSIFNISCPSIIPSDTVTSDFLPTAPISANEV
jgi:hypothetical protein